MKGRLGLLALGAAIASAASPGAVLAIGVTPLRATLDSGESTTAISVFNGEPEARVFTAEVSGFAPGSTGASLLGQAGARTTAASISVSPSRIEIPAGDKAVLTVTASAAPNLGPGVWPSLVLITQQPARNANRIKGARRVGVWVNRSIPGQLSNGAVINSIQVFKRAKAGGATFRPMRFRLRSTGNTVLAVQERTLRLTLFAGTKPGGRRLATLLPRGYSATLLPGASKWVKFRYRGRYTGPVRAVATVRVPAVAQTPTSRAVAGKIVKASAKRRL